MTDTQLAIQMSHLWQIFRPFNRQQARSIPPPTLAFKDCRENE
jgi:hypothetical protein